ncbi:MAG TPA: DUF4158 domain-containing protein [Ktedonobacteraceae bacterium]|nr:DUF4158 domain-containing protein [Ktedonobacteraceae bacterium]
MPGYDKIPTYLNPEQRHALTQIPLALLKFPGRTLMEVKEVPRAVLTAIAEQVDVPASAFTSYGGRENTLYEHLDELRRECGFRSCGWREYLLVAR